MDLSIYFVYHTTFFYSAVLFLRCDIFHSIYFSGYLKSYIYMIFISSLTWGKMKITIHGMNIFRISIFPLILLHIFIFSVKILLFPTEIHIFECSSMQVFALQTFFFWIWVQWNCNYDEGIESVLKHLLWGGLFCCISSILSSA